MSEKAITTSPSAVSRARSGRSTCAHPARSSIELRTVAPMPLVISESAVRHAVLMRERREPGATSTPTRSLVGERARVRLRVSFS